MLLDNKQGRKVHKFAIRGELLERERERERKREKWERKREKREIERDRDSFGILYTDYLLVKRVSKK